MNNSTTETIKKLTKQIKDLNETIEKLSKELEKTKKPCPSGNDCPYQGNYKPTKTTEPRYGC